MDHKNFQLRNYRILWQPLDKPRKFNQDIREMVKVILNFIAQLGYILGRAFTKTLRSPKFLDDDWPPRKMPRR